MTHWIIKPDAHGGYYLARESTSGIELRNRGSRLDLDTAQHLMSKLNSELECQK
jgi:hypothetical protein